MINHYLRKRRHVRFVHSRLYDLKYEILNQSLKMTNKPAEEALYKEFHENMKHKACLFKKYQRRLKLLQF